MYHVAFTPEYSPSNALSAKADTLTEALSMLLKDFSALDPDGWEHWFLAIVLQSMMEATQNLADGKEGSASWFEMGCDDDAFRIDIFTDEDARYIRHNGEKWLAPHGAVGFVSDKLQELWIYDEAEIGDYDNVLLPEPCEPCSYCGQNCNDENGCDGFMGDIDGLERGE